MTSPIIIRQVAPSASLAVTPASGYPPLTAQLRPASGNLFYTPSKIGFSGSPSSTWTDADVESVVLQKRIGNGAWETFYSATVAIDGTYTMDVPNNIDIEIAGTYSFRVVGIDEYGTATFSVSNMVYSNPTLAPNIEINDLVNYFPDVELNIECAFGTDSNPVPVEYVTSASFLFYRYLAGPNGNAQLLSEEDVTATGSTFQTTFTPDSVAWFRLRFTCAVTYPDGTTENKTVDRDIQIISPSEGSYYNFYIQTDPDHRAAFSERATYRAGQLGITTSEYYRDELYQSISDAITAGETLFIAPRTWKEAGRIIAVNKATKDGYPFVVATVQKRVGSLQQGMDRFAAQGETDHVIGLPINEYDTKEQGGVVYPRGVVFATPQPDNIPVIRLSSPHDYTYIDEYGETVTKEGLDSHPVVVFAQNDNLLSRNAFGGLCYRKEGSAWYPIYNTSFQFAPFQPFFTLLNRSEYDEVVTSNIKLACYTFGATRHGSSSTGYRPEHVHALSPFTIESLKFRRNQEKETRQVWIDNIPNYIDTEDEENFLQTPWGKSDSPKNSSTIDNAFSGWRYTGASYSGSAVANIQLPYKWAGCALLAAKTGSEVNRYSQFAGNPYNLGIYGNELRYTRSSIMDSHDYLFSSTGTYNISDDSDENPIMNSVHNISFVGGATSALVGASTKMWPNKSAITQVKPTIIRPLSNDNRYIMFANGNRVSVFDTYKNADLANYIVFGSNSATVKNLDRAGEVNFFYKPSYTPDANPNIVSYDNTIMRKFPMSAKYFSGTYFGMNLNHERPLTDWRVVYGQLGYAPATTPADNQSIDTKVALGFLGGNPMRENVDAYYTIQASAMDNFVYFSNETEIGISLLGQKSFTYTMDNRGQINEEVSGNTSVVSTFSDLIQSFEKNTFSLSLNSEDGPQTVTFIGNYDGIPFMSTSKIVLAESVKPILFDGRKKIFSNDPEFQLSAQISFCTTGWIPDSVKFAFGHLAEYITEFTSAESVYDFQMTNVGGGNYRFSCLQDIEGKWTKDGAVVSGAHCVVIGLESWPSGDRKNGFRANYEQNSQIDLLDNYSTKIIVINTDDIVITIPNRSTTNNGEPTVVTDFVQFDMAIKSYVLSLPPVTSMVFDSDRNFTAIIVSLPNIPVTDVPNSLPNNRFSGCTMICESGKRFQVLSNDSGSLVVQGDATSYAGETAAIAAFIPDQWQVENSQGPNCNKESLELKEITEDRVKFNIVSHGIIRLEGNRIILRLFEDDDCYSFDSELVFPGRTKNGEISGSSTYVELGFYGNYDAATKIFSRKLLLGARTQSSDFYHILDSADYTGISTPSSVFIRIKSSKALDVEKGLSLLLVNKDTQENIVDPITEFEQLDAAGKTFKAVMSVDPQILNDPLLRVDISFTAYDEFEEEVTL